MTNFKQVQDNIFIGGQPSGQDLQAAAGQGIKNVVDLRLPSEEGAAPRSGELGGLLHSNLPVDKTALSDSMVEEFDRLLCGLEGPVLIHCATGARAALLLALSRAKAERLDAAATFALAREMGFDLAAMPVFAEFIERVTGQWNKEQP